MSKIKKRKKLKILKNASSEIKGEKHELKSLPKKLNM